MAATSSVYDPGDIKINMKQLYASDLFSDLTIECQGTVFKAHKFALYLQSSVFKQLLGGKFKEASENHDSITLDDQPEILRGLLFYLYNFVYSESCREDHDAATFAVEIYSIADKYDIKKLQDLAASKLKQVADPKQNLDEFARAMYTIDTHTNPTDRTLWDVLLPKIEQNITYLLEQAEFRELIEDIPPLKFDLLAFFDPAKEMAVGEEQVEVGVDGLRFLPGVGFRLRLG